LPSPSPSCSIGSLRYRFAGQVYKAIDKRNGHVVAVKEIPLEGMDESAMAAVTLETDLLSSLHHPNVVSYLGSIKANGYVDPESTTLNPEP